ncbi:MAG: carbamoyltransferase family protein, partial [Bacteroidia bacterium]
KFDKRKLKLLFPEHHLSHAASCFYPSKFDEAAILTIDGVGEWATASIGIGRGNKIEILKELHFPDSLGLLYSAFTYYLGFKVNSGEYKLMGLAPYGNRNAEAVNEYILIIKKTLAEVKDDGSLKLNQEYFTYATGLRMVPDKKWQNLFGFPVRKSTDELLQQHCDLALAIQIFTEEVVLKMGAHAKAITGMENLCMAGGVALNSVVNGKIYNSGLFKDIFIQPASGDAGGALGAALAAYHIYFDKERSENYELDGMKGSYLGPEFSEIEIKLVAKKYKAKFREFADFKALCKSVSVELAIGKIIGWFQGRMEFGPRALGNRSILGDPRNPEMQKKLNLSIKFRESFRPFAPAVLAEDVQEYFKHFPASPYMLLVQEVADKIKLSLPQDFEQLPLQEKLYTKRSTLPAVTHVDFSARLQTVHNETNPQFWQLLQSFKSLTACPVLVNTSFNVRGEPIVCTPEDAYRCFMRTEMDLLVIGNLVFYKTDQPEWQNTDNWQQEFTLD